MLDLVMSPFRIATRRLLRQAGFSATVVCTLALAIAAATTVFSYVNALLLRPFPFREPRSTPAALPAWAANGDTPLVRAAFARWAPLPASSLFGSSPVAYSRLFEPSYRTRSLLRRLAEGTLQNGIRDLRNQSRAEFEAVQFLQLCLDIAPYHAAR